MRRGAAVALGVLAGILGGAIIVTGLWLMGCGRAPRRAAAAPAASAPASPAPAPAGVELAYEEVTVYLRDPGAQLALVAIPGRIIAFPSTLDRARQIVRLVLDGVPEATGGEPPVRAGVVLRDVYLDDQLTAWIDLDAASLRIVGGSDEEQALVAALSRSLTDNLDEVGRVGFLVSGRPAETLAGHVDATRTYTGYEWPGPPRSQP